MDILEHIFYVLNIPVTRTCEFLVSNVTFFFRVLFIDSKSVVESLFFFMAVIYEIHFQKGEKFP